jgi:hypothetical protein
MDLLHFASVGDPTQILPFLLACIYARFGHIYYTPDLLSGTKPNFKIIGRILESWEPSMLDSLQNVCAKKLKTK